MHHQLRSLCCWRGVSPIANGMATAADWMSAASFISMAGIISFAGYDGSVYLMGWTGGYVLLALLLAPYLRKFGKFTVPDFIGDRYYSNTAKGSSCLCFNCFLYLHCWSNERSRFGLFRYTVKTSILMIWYGIVLFMLYDELKLGLWRRYTKTMARRFTRFGTLAMRANILVALLAASNPNPKSATDD